tara:strand:- start:1054 stop:1221 length:168 start_codon:yes stop_codon:yes gene_type:complete
MISVKRPNVSRRLSHCVSYGWMKAVATQEKTRISSATRIWRYCEGAKRVVVGGGV